MLAGAAIIESPARRNTPPAIPKIDDISAASPDNIIRENIGITPILYQNYLLLAITYNR